MQSNIKHTDRPTTKSNLWNVKSALLIADQWCMVSVSISSGRISLKAYQELHISVSRSAVLSWVVCPIHPTACNVLSVVPWKDNPKSLRASFLFLVFPVLLNSFWAKKFHLRRTIHCYWPREFIIASEVHPDKGKAFTRLFPFFTVQRACLIDYMENHINLFAKLLLKNIKININFCRGKMWRAEPQIPLRITSSSASLFSFIL